MDEKASADELVDYAATIVSAYVSNNSVPMGQLAGLISSVHAALTALNAGPNIQASPQMRAAPPVPIRKSVTPDYLVSLEDGQRYKSLKRHLSGRGLSPEQYREKWGLPSNYPMVAPNYAKQRSELAKAAGLGTARSRGARTTARAKGKLARAKI